MAVSNVIWIGGGDDKVYKSSGPFTITLSDSLDVGPGGGGLDVEAEPVGVEVTATDTVFGGDSDNKVYRVAGGPSGALQATLIDSQEVAGWLTQVRGTGFDGDDTLFGGDNWMYKLSGVFTGTLSDSRNLDALGGGLTGICWDGSNILYVKNTPTRLCYKLQGFTNTQDSNVNLTAWTGQWGVAWDGTNFYWCEDTNNKLMKMSGFTNTVSDSLGTGGIDTNPFGIAMAPRLGASPTIVAAGLATETDTAFAIATILRTYAIGLATETDTALPVSFSQTVVTALIKGLVQCEVEAIDVVNQALVKLGAARIDSLDQEHPNAYVALDIYLDTLDAELRSHVWNFAKTKRRLAQSGTAPVSGFDLSYPLPVDCLRVINVHGDDAEAYAPVYEIVGRAIETDSIECWLTYIRRECNFEAADASFFEVMAYRLAIEMTGAVTGLVSNRDKMKKGYRRALARARSTDAIEDYPEQMPESSWLTVRRR